MDHGIAPAKCQVISINNKMKSMIATYYHILKQDYYDSLHTSQRRTSIGRPHLAQEVIAANSLYHCL